MKNCLDFLSSSRARQVFYTILYVLPFYLHPTTRPSPNLWRDSPAVIRTRIRLVSTSVIICTFITTYILAQKIHYSRLAILHIFGVYPTPLISSILSPFLLTACLFAGPLFESIVIESRWRQWLTLRPIKESLNTWTGWRNFVAGPLSEEVLFRSLIISLHLITPVVENPSYVPKSAQSAPNRHPNPTYAPVQPFPHPSLRLLIFITPLYFGIAHIHHCYETRLQRPQTPFLPILLNSLIQFAYTTVFGWYAAFLFLRTGSLWGVVLVHSFCNWMGLPRFWGRVGGELLDVATQSVGIDAGAGIAMQGSGHGTGMGSVRGRVRGKEDDDYESEGHGRGELFSPGNGNGHGNGSGNGHGHGHGRDSNGKSKSNGGSNGSNGGANMKPYPISNNDNIDNGSKNWQWKGTRKTPNRSGRSSPSSSSRLSIWWTVAYYTILIAGVVGWYQGLWALTNSPDTVLVDFEKVQPVPAYLTRELDTGRRGAGGR